MEVRRRALLCHQNQSQWGSVVYRGGLRHPRHPRHLGYHPYFSLLSFSLLFLYPLLLYVFCLRCRRLSLPPGFVVG